jgi:dTDP-D-glucose 4,6-dehydratase
MRPGRVTTCSTRSDGQKLADEGWVSPIQFDEAIRLAVEWYAANRDWLV